MKFIFVRLGIKFILFGLNVYTDKIIICPFTNDIGGGRFMNVIGGGTFH